VASYQQENILSPTTDLMGLRTVPEMMTNGRLLGSVDHQTNFLHLKLVQAAASMRKFVIPGSQAFGFSVAINKVGEE